MCCSSKPFWAFLIIIFLISSPSYAAVGTKGPNGKIPWLTIEHKYVGHPVKVSLHDLAPYYSRILYVFSDREERRSFVQGHGEGAILLPYLSKENPTSVISTQSTIELTPPTEMLGQKIYFQAVVEYPGGGLVFSRPKNLTLAEMKPNENREFNVAGLVPSADSIRDMDLDEETGHIYAVIFEVGLTKYKSKSNTNPAYEGFLRLDKPEKSITKLENVSAAHGRAVLTSNSNSIALAKTFTTEEPKLLGTRSEIGRKLRKSEIFQINNTPIAIVDAYNDGLLVYDISSKQSFEAGPLVNFSQNDFILGITKHKNNLLYAFTGDKRALVYKIQNTYSPIKQKDLSLSEKVIEVAFNNDYAFFLSNSGNKVVVANYDANGVAQNVVGSIDLGVSANFSKIKVEGNIVYLLDEKRGIEKYEFNSQTLTLSLQNFLDVEGAQAMVFDGGVVHVGVSWNHGIAADDGLWTYSKSSFQKIGNPIYNQDREDVTDLEIVDKKIGNNLYRFAFVNDFGNALHVINVTNHKKPIHVNSIPVAGTFTAIRAIDDRIAVGERTPDSESYLHIASIENPQGILTIEKTIQLDGSVNDIVYDGNYIYVANGFKGFKVFSINNQDLIPVATLMPPVALSRVIKITLSSYVAYVVTMGGLMTVDISEPEKPEIIQFLPYDFKNGRLSADNNMLRIAENDMGVISLDISAPYSPQGVSIIGQQASGQWTGDVKIRNNYVISSRLGVGATNNVDGLVFWDLYDPEHWTEMELPQLSFTYGIAIKDDPTGNAKSLIYVADAISLVATIEEN